jgi:hypothetical protein
MAATNFTPIQLYFSTTASAVPLAANLAQGELAINITDGKLYYEDNGGVVQVIATKGAGTIGGSNTQIQYNNAGALAGNAAMTFNSATSTTTLTTLNLTNALGATFGGTAQSSYTQGDILYSSATNTLAKLGIGTVNFILTSTGSVPQWVAPTSITVQTANNLAGGLAGSVPYQSAVDTTTFLAIGAANRVMTSTGSAPQWVTSLTGLTGVSSSSITNTSLTSGRVVVSTTAGLQADDADLTFDGTTLSAGGLSTVGLSTLVKTVTIGNSSFNGSAVFAAATPAKLYMGTGTVTDVTSAISATNAIGAIASLGITPIAATNTSVTYTNAATLYIAGAPSAGTNVTLTNPYALYVAAGDAFFGGTVTAGTVNLTTLDLTNLEVTNIKAKDGTAAITIADSTGAVAVSTNMTIGNAASDTLTVTSTITSNLIFTDNTYDIGASGATRPRNLYLSGLLTMGGALTVGGLVSGAGTNTWTIQSVAASGSLVAGGWFYGGNEGLNLSPNGTGLLKRLTISYFTGSAYSEAIGISNVNTGPGTGTLSLMGSVATVTSSGITLTAGSTAYLTGSLGSRLWTPSLAIGTGTYSGLYGPSLTYLAEKSGGSWVSTGGGTAGALGIDEGHFYFARSNGVGAPGDPLIWTTYLSSDTGGNFFFSSTGATKVSSGTTAQRPGTIVAGQMRWNTSFPQLEVGDGTTFQKVVTEPLVTSASGGTITTDGDYKVHTFTSSGTFTLTTISGATRVLVQVMILGGGGGGGFYLGGGGGSGAMLETEVSMSAGSYTVTVGAGGTAVNSGFTYSGNGGLSSITGSLVSLNANGGGAGGNGQINDAWGANGSATNNIGSGGGGGSPYGVTISNSTVNVMLGGSAGWNGSGGAFGTAYTGSATFNGGGGGGGAQSAGVAPNIGNGPVGAGGIGGSARPSYITGSLVSYGGGGGGGYGTYLANQTISGGSGAGSGVGTASSGGQLQATSGSANLGGGGGGGQATATYQQGGAGGSGVVIVRYKFQ